MPQWLIIVNLHNPELEFMSSEIDGTSRSPNGWFTTDVVYEGWGRAEFLNPPCTVEGKTVIRLDTSGESSISFSDVYIRMKVESISPTPSSKYKLQSMLRGRLFQEGDPEPLNASDLYHNTCSVLTISTSHGVFSASEDIHYTYGHTYNFEQDEVLDEWLEFYAPVSQFDTKDCELPKYWVLPLKNLIVRRFVHEHPDLIHHPLRIDQSSSTSNSLPDNPERNSNSTRYNHLIIFEFNSGLGFIEPLPNYYNLLKHLETGQTRRTITAVMVGEVGANSIEFADLKRWFPFDFLPLLGLATGTEVGAPWIEFRDIRGTLVRRIHYQLEKPIFLKGHAAINEIIHRSTGNLLTSYATSEYYGKSLLRVVIKNIIRGGAEDLVIEEGLSRLFVALDALCLEFGLTRSQPIKKLLDKQKRADLNAIIDTAAKSIQGLIVEQEQEGNQATAEALKKIQGKVGDSINITQSYGKSVIALIKHFSLFDTEIIEKHYEDHPRADRKEWDRVLSTYRGTTMHRSYFDFEEGASEVDINDVVRIKYHLHDVLIRIVLKIIGYSGHYQPTVIPATASLPLDWVTPDLPAEQLGYQ